MKTSAIIFSLLTEEDIDEVAVLEAITFPTPWTAAQYRAMMGGGCCTLFGARENGELVGYIALASHAATREMEVYNLAVAVRNRQRGIGGKLLSLALRAACKNGIERVILEVRETNQPALALYASHGFVRVGVRSGYYPDTGEDALVLARVFHAGRDLPVHSPDLDCDRDHSE